MMLGSDFLVIELLRDVVHRKSPMVDFRLIFCKFPWLDVLWKDAEIVAIFTGGPLEITFLFLAPDIMLAFS